MPTNFQPPSPLNFSGNPNPGFTQQDPGPQLGAAPPPPVAGQGSLQAVQQAQGAAGGALGGGDALGQLAGLQDRRQAPAAAGGQDELVRQALLQMMGGFSGVQREPHVGGGGLGRLSGGFGGL